MKNDTKELPRVLPGQVWIDNDKRNMNRALRVERSSADTGEYAHCMIGFIRDGAFVPSNRTVKILKRRFRPTSTGYRLNSGDVAAP